MDCYNAGATVLHVHVRDPKTGQVSKNFNEYNDQIGRLRKAVPKMVLQVGGSISFAPQTTEARPIGSTTTRATCSPSSIPSRTKSRSRRARTLGYHAGFDPDDVKGTHLDDPKVQAA